MIKEKLLRILISFIGKSKGTTKTSVVIIIEITVFLVNREIPDIITVITSETNSLIANVIIITFKIDKPSEILDSSSILQAAAPNSFMP